MTRFFRNCVAGPKTSADADADGRRVAGSIKLVGLYRTSHRGPSDSKELRRSRRHSAQQCSHSCMACARGSADGKACTACKAHRAARDDAKVAGTSSITVGKRQIAARSLLPSTPGRVVTCPTRMPTCSMCASRARTEAVNRRAHARVSRSDQVVHGRYGGMRAFCHQHEQ